MRYLITALLLFLSLFASAQAGMMLASPAAAPGASYLLDTYTGAFAGHALSKLSSSATNCITLVRQSDLDTTVIGFSGQDIDEATINSYCSGTTCYVSRVHDQTGNGWHLANTYTDTAALPIIYHNSIIRQGGKAALYSEGSRFLYKQVSSMPVTGDITFDFFMVVNNTSSGTDYHIFQLTETGTTTTDRRRIVIFANDTGAAKSIRYYGGNAVFSSSATGQLLVNANYQGTANAGADSRLRFNGSALTYSSGSGAGLNIQSNSGFSILNGEAGIPPVRYNGSSASVSGYFQLLVMYFSDQSSNRTGIESNINSYYSIY